MSLNPIGPRPLAQRSLVQASTAPVATANAKAAEGDEKPDPVGGLAGKAFEFLKEVGGDLNKFRKEHPFLAILVAAAGFFTGWKLDELARRAQERSEGNLANQAGQNAYLAFKNQGPDALVKAVSDEHTFFDNIKSWPKAIFPNDWTDAKKWAAFNTHTVLAELDRSTIGDIDGKANMPIVLTALAKNKTADKTALTALASGIRTRINGAPAKQGFYQPVIDALKATHNITV
jgi:hypothetical protein